jgi:hypothetical protein
MMLGVGICKPQGESRLIQIGLTSKAQSRLVYFEVGHNMGELTTRGIQVNPNWIDLNGFVC